MGWKTQPWWLKYFLSVHRSWCSPRLKQKKKKPYQPNKKLSWYICSTFFLWYWKSIKVDVLYQTSVPRLLPRRHSPLLQGCFFPSEFHKGSGNWKQSHSLQILHSMRKKKKKSIYISGSLTQASHCLKPLQSTRFPFHILSELSGSYHLHCHKK